MFPVVHLIRLRILPEPTARSSSAFCAERITAKKELLAFCEAAG